MTFDEAWNLGESDGREKHHHRRFIEFGEGMADAGTGRGIVCIVTSDSDRWSPEQVDRRARLVSAAPELSNALEALIQDPESVIALEEAHLALEKAGTL